MCLLQAPPLLMPAPSRTGTGAAPSIHELLLYCSNMTRKLSGEMHHEPAQDTPLFYRCAGLTSAAHAGRSSTILSSATMWPRDTVMIWSEVTACRTSCSRRLLAAEVLLRVSA